jgi:ribokinase
MRESSLYAARRAKELGIPVMLDAGRVREGMLELARISDYVVASEEFARDIGWNDDCKAMQKKVRGLGFSTTTITFGDRGSITFTGDEIITMSAFRVDVVDTTGAGDVFHGGYIYGLLKGLDVRDTLRFASALAAMKCERLGGRAGIPRPAAVRRFLADRGYHLEI